MAVKRTPNPVTRTVISRRDVSCSNSEASISTFTAEAVVIGPASPIARNYGNDNNNDKVKE